MKFCLINNLYPPYLRGGAEQIVELLAKGFEKYGEVLIITSQAEDISSCQVDGDLEICRLNPQNIYYLLNNKEETAFQKVRWHLKDLYNFWILGEVKKILKRAKPDFIFTHNLKGLSLGIPKIIRKLHLTHIHTLHDYQLLDPHGSMHRQEQNLALKNPFYVIYRCFTRQAIKNPDLVISPSMFVLDKHLNYGFFKRSKTAVLPNPIKIQNGESKIRNSTESKLRLLYLGQIEPPKGVNFLIKSFLKWGNDEAELTIAGEGSQLQESPPSLYELRMAGKKVLLGSTSYGGSSFALRATEDRQGNKIEILGKVEREKIPELFRQSDLLIVPSIWWENSPTVIYEAYSHKVPVLVSDSGGSKELVKDGQTGWIFKSGDENDLLDKLKTVFEHKNQLPKMGESGYRWVQNFTIDNYVNKLLQLCQDLKK